MCDVLAVVFCTLLSLLMFGSVIVPTRRIISPNRQKGTAYNLPLLGAGETAKLAIRESPV